MPTVLSGKHFGTELTGLCLGPTFWTGHQSRLLACCLCSRNPSGSIQADLSCKLSASLSVLAKKQKNKKKTFPTPKSTRGSHLS